MAVDGELSLPPSHAFSSGYAGNLAYAYIDRLSRQTAPAPSMDGAGAFVIAGLRCLYRSSRRQSMAASSPRVAVRAPL